MSVTEFAAAPPLYSAKAMEAGDDAPPPYELEKMIVQTYEELEKKYKEDPEATEKAIAEALGNSDSSKAFVHDMNGLSLTITTLNNLFSHVNSGLARIDGEKLPSDTTGEIIEWQPQWEVIRSLYTDTMLKSRTLATSLASRVDSFFNTILPKLKGDTLDDEQKEQMLTYFLGEKVDAKSYNQALEKDENAAEQIYKDFDKIKTDVAKFRGRFGAWFQRAQDQLQKDITDLKGDIDKIKADLESLIAQRSKSLAVRDIGAKVGGVGAILMATGVLAPLATIITIAGALTALGAGIQSANLQSKIADKQAELYRKQTDYDILIAKQKEVNTVIKPLVEHLNNDMDQIGGKLQTMQNIWAFIKSQAQTARIEVTKAIDSEAPIFLKDDVIDVSIQAYKVLHICVRMYGEGYDNTRE